VKVVTLYSGQHHSWNKQESEMLCEVWNYDTFLCLKVAAVLATSL
jgi:hypothetical protein